MSENKKKGFYLVSSTEGCTTNLYENSSYEKYLIERGLTREAEPGDAEYIIVNTCGYNESMQSRSKDMILDLKKRFGEDKKIVVGGCFPSMDKLSFKKNIELPSFKPGDTEALHSELELPEETRKFEEARNEQISFDISEIDNLTSMHKFVLSIRSAYFSLERKIGFKFQPLHNLMDTALINESYTPILTGTGCLGKCTFCAIKMAKGKIKSRPLPVLKSIFETELKNGKSKIWLLGDDIGCWGQDLDTNSYELLKSFLDSQFFFKLVVTYYDPEWLEKYYDQGLDKILADKRIVSINFPIQTGSDAVIADMQRFYSINSVLDKVRKIKKANPALGVKTNFIVGFPGETWADFFMSLRALFYFDAVFVNRYGRVSNTLAAKKDNQVSPLVKDLRFYLMWSASNMRHVYVALKSLLYRIKISM